MNSIVITPKFVLAVAALLGVLAVFIWLLANPKTRWTAVAVLGVVLGIPFVLSFLWFSAKYEVREPELRPGVTMHESRQAPPAAPLTVEISRAPPAATSPGNLLRAIGQAIVRATEPDQPRNVPATAQPIVELPPQSAKRPTWIGLPPGNEGDVFRMTTFVGPYATPLERDADMPEVLQMAMTDYVKRYVGTEAAGRVRFPPAELERQIVKDHFDETVDPPLGLDQPMTKRHLLLEFNPKMQERIKDQWQQAIIAGRLWRAGEGLAAVLALLAVVFGYLKLTQATRAHRGRLGLAAVILAALVIAAWAITG